MSDAVAAIDCGTNTIKLLVTDGRAPDGALRTLAREARMVRLGQGVDRTGRLAEEAMARTFAAIEEYAAIIEAHAVRRINFCATSATRDAANAAEFADGVRARLGIDPEVLSGDAEAALAFAGALGVVDEHTARPVLVIDIGGGSTELILGDRAPEEAASMDIGSVRLTERHLAGDPPSAAEVEALLADVDAALDACPVDPSRAATVVGVAGTITTVAAHALDLAAYDRDAIHGVRLPADAVVAATREIAAMTLAERRAIPSMHPGRADVIGAGGLIMARVLERARASSLVVSEADILDGIAFSLLDS